MPLEIPWPPNLLSLTLSTFVKIFSPAELTDLLPPPHISLSLSLSSLSISLPTCMMSPHTFFGEIDFLC